MMSEFFKKGSCCRGADAEDNNLLSVLCSAKEHLICSCPAIPFLKPGEGFLTHPACNQPGKWGRCKIGQVNTGEFQPVKIFNPFPGYLLQLAIFFQEFKG